jgi:hypothetical protein
VGGAGVGRARCAVAYGRVVLGDDGAVVSRLCAVLCTFLPVGGYCRTQCLPFDRHLEVCLEAAAHLTKQLICWPLVPTSPAA